MPQTKILLLTNRDSDNVGDQLIEESVISLLHGIMNNLGFSTEDYSVTSRAAGIITKKYLRTGDPKLLTGARTAISDADIIVFGGAPLFNYSYQVFYQRTIKTLELAQEYGVPVIFSSIGVEKYDATNPKVQELQKALHLSCVKQITTRDDLDSLNAYMQGTAVPTGRVSDPVVLGDLVFGKKAAKPTATKKIGLVVTREGIFKANGIDFTEAQQREFWLETIAELKRRGYDYKLFTTGHFADEVFLDALVRAKGIPEGKAKVNVNSPEELIKEVRSCAGVIAFRLHANIASYAYDVPAVGLTWNSKVPFFYDSIGYPQRALSSESWNAVSVVDAIETAMEQGVHKDQDFLMSVYNSLFDGIKEIVDPGSPIAAYSYAQLAENLPKYEGTTLERYREKLNKKLRRTYESYQSLATKAPTSPAATAPVYKRAIRKLRNSAKRVTG